MSFSPKRTFIDGWKYVFLSLKGNKVKKEMADAERHKVPILLIQGFLGVRGVMNPLEQRLKEEGFTVFSINLGVINIKDIRKSAFKIHMKVEEILFNYELDQIHIIGHSMGGLIGLYYVKKLGGKDRVKKLIAMGTPFQGTWMAWLGVAVGGLVMPSAWQMVPNSFFVRELHASKIPDSVEVYSIIARGDLVCPPNQSLLDGARIIKVDHGHVTLIFSTDVFDKILEILAL